MDTLLYKTGSKRIVECASDHPWGTGLSLGEPSCLDSSKWVSQGILGKILESIRNEACQIRGQSHLVLPPPTTTSLASLNQGYHATAAKTLSTSHCTPSVLNHSSSVLQNMENQCICRGACGLHARQPHRFVKLYHVVAMVAT